MSSHTDDKPPDHFYKLNQRALTRARLARLLGLVAGISGLGLIVLFLFQSGFFALFQAEVSTPLKTVPATNQMSGTGTIIRGIDQHGQTFTISSASAIQDETDKATIHLTTAKGIFERAAGLLNLSSRTATYNTNSKALQLEGQVVFEQQGRYKAQMEKALMNVDSMNLSSQSSVHVDLNNGVVDADHLEISEGGKKTLFTGHVKAILQSDVNASLQPDVKSEIVP